MPWELLNTLQYPGKARSRSKSVVGCLNTAVYKNIKLVYKNIKLGTLSAPMHMHADTHSLTY